MKHKYKLSMYANSTYSVYSLIHIYKAACVSVGKEHACFWIESSKPGQKTPNGRFSRPQSLRKQRQWTFSTSTTGYPGLPLHLC